MSDRRRVRDVLERMAFAAALKGDRNARRYTMASLAIRRAEGDLAALVESGALMEQKGIGKGTLSIARDVLAGRTPARLADLEAGLPAGLFDLRALEGLGAKKIKTLHETLGVASLAELEYACRENRLVDLPGFGDKTQRNVLAAIGTLRSREGKLRRDQARALAAEAEEALVSAGAEAVVVAGALRRGAELVREVVVVVAGDLQPSAPLPEALRVVRTAPEAFGWAMLEATGPADFVRAVRARAEAQGLQVTEEGLTDAGQLVATFDEADVFERLGLWATPPERREVGGPVPRGTPGPRLVRRSDLEGALHNHTTASDGTASLGVMRDAAAARGLRYLGISEHSEAAHYAGGLDAARLEAQRAEVASLNDEAHRCTLLTGVESDILEDGRLDTADEVLATLDCVIASVHRRHGQGREAITARMVRAAQHPKTAVIGHPTGRLLLGRAPTDLDVEALLDACAASGCAIELNANPQRLDLSAAHAAMARERGVPVSIAADAHAPDELDHLDHGIAIARRAGLRPEDEAKYGRELAATEVVSELTERLR
ncbi:MAG: helix-hairpin-helix domain-containing protein [Myxococcota bacterium]